MTPDEKRVAEMKRLREMAKEQEQERRAYLELIYELEDSILGGDVPPDQKAVEKYIKDIDTPEKLARELVAQWALIGFLQVRVALLEGNPDRAARALGDGPVEQEDGKSNGPTPDKDA